MKNPNNYQYQLGMWDRVPANPYLRPAVVPRSPTKHDYYSGIMMPGTFAYKPCDLAYYQTQTQSFILPNTFDTNIRPVKVFVGQAPVRGVITGVKSGR